MLPPAVALCWLKEESDLKQQTLQLNSICFVSRKSALGLSLHLQDFLLKSRLALFSTRIPSNVKGREKVTQGEKKERRRRRRREREEREKSQRGRMKRGRAGTTGSLQFVFDLRRGARKRKREREKTTSICKAN